MTYTAWFARKQLDGTILPNEVPLTMTAFGLRLPNLAGGAITKKGDSAGVYYRGIRVTGDRLAIEKTGDGIVFPTAPGTTGDQVAA